MCPSLKNTFFDSFPKYWKQGFQVLLLLIFGMGMGYGQTLTISDVSGVEDGGLITVTVVLDDAVTDGFTIEVNTNDGTATVADNDYTSITDQVLNFVGTAGESQSFDVSPIADSKVEADETLTISMSNLGGVGTDVVDISDTGTVTILNDDSVIVEFSQSEGSDNENVGGNLPVLIITGEVVNPSTVMITDTETGTASLGTDYTFNNPQVVIIPVGVYDGTMSTSIQIPTFSIAGDAEVEADETIELVLGSPTGDISLGGVVNTTYTILNDDISPPSGYGVEIDLDPINISNHEAVSFTILNPEIGADYSYLFTSDGDGGTTQVSGMGTIADTNPIVGIDLSDLPDGIITLRVTLSNSGGLGPEVEDTADKNTVIPTDYSVTIIQ